MYLGLLGIGSRSGDVALFKQGQSPCATKWPLARHAREAAQASERKDAGHVRRGTKDAGARPSKAGTRQTENNTDAPGCLAAFCGRLENSRAGKSAMSLTLRSYRRTRPTKSQPLPRKRTQGILEMPLPGRVEKALTLGRRVGWQIFTQLGQVRHNEASSAMQKI